MQSAGKLEVCELFEADWKRHGQPPEWSKYLDHASVGERKSLFQLLLPIDLKYRRDSGLAQSTSVDDYPEEYSEVVKAVLETTEQLDAGEATSLTTDAKLLASGGKQASSQKTSKPTDERERLGRYTLLQELGRGGQGTVYRAAHPTLPIEVVLKVGHLSLNTNSQNALLAEAHVLCELEHPGIARVRDLDFDETGRPILVLDLVRGRSLQAILSEGRIEIKQATQWILAAASAVAYAHRRGVLHLDLKPGNIIIDEAGEVRVIDFGLAKLRNAWADPQAEPDGISGTPEYMAPEQARGIAEEVGAQADVFGLGAILFRMLTGTTPFAGETRAATVRNAAAGRVKLTPLDEVADASALCAICRKAVAVDPADRFATADDLADAIREQLVSSSESPSAPSTVASRFPTSRQVVIGVCVTVLFVAIWFGKLNPFANPAESNTPTVEADKKMAATSLNAALSDTESPDDAPSVLQGTNLLSQDIVERFSITASRDKGPLQPLSNLLPLQNGDHIHLSVKLKEPAHVRLVWIDAAGNPSEIYPRDPELGFRGDEPVMEVESPSDPIRGWPVEAEGGMETAVLLVSREPFQDLEIQSLRTDFEKDAIATEASYFVAAADMPARPQNVTRASRSLGSKSAEVGWTTVLDMLNGIRDRCEVANAIAIPLSP